MRHTSIGPPESIHRFHEQSRYVAANSPNGHAWQAAI
jgi:hypothetical protein